MILQLQNAPKLVQKELLRIQIIKFVLHALLHVPRVVPQEQFVSHVFQEPIYTCKHALVLVQMDFMELEELQMSVMHVPLHARHALVQAFRHVNLATQTLDITNNPQHHLAN